MQKKMKMNAMDKGETEKLLEAAQTGVFCTIGRDGYPYGVPVQFVYEDGNVYFHCLVAGEKLDNIKENDQVCFTAYEMGGVWRPDGMEYMCGLNTEYKSAIVRGSASVVRDDEEKTRILKSIVRKYAPGLADMPMKASSYVKAAVVEIRPHSVTGKHGNTMPAGGLLTDKQILLKTIQIAAICIVFYCVLLRTMI
jgi:nitroimidazol reductase NimA-like FMN-containing flavoprotein (pyridoxamine 5'-phosphate oxidase superfamily)